SPELRRQALSAALGSLVASDQKRKRSLATVAQHQLLGSRCQISPSPKLNHLVVVTFCWVKNWTPSLPCMWRSPKNDSFQPLNGNQAMEAGTPMLIPTMPHWMRCLNSRAALPEPVKIDAPLR